MTTYHTGNPVGSTNPKDLYDNAQNLDDLMLGQLRQYLDRLGVPRLSWAGIEAAFLEDQAQRSLDFDEAQTNRENVFNQFLTNTQFEMPPIPYQEGAPIEVSRPTQLISHEGQLYSVKLPASFPFQLSGIWDVAVVSLTPREDASLRQQLAASGGAMLVGSVAVAIASILELIRLPLAKLRVDATYVLASYLPDAASANLIGGGRLVWVPDMPKSRHNGFTVFSPTVPWNGSRATLPAFMAKTGETSPAGKGCFVRAGDELLDTMGGVRHDGTDEGLVLQGVLNALKSGDCLVLTGITASSTTLVLAADSVTFQSRGQPYFSGGGGFLALGSAEMLKVTGFGFRANSVVFRDARPALGSVTAGTVGISFERPGGVPDIDASLSNCLFERLETCVKGKGINLRITDSIFSYSRYCVDGYQISGKDFRGWVVEGNRFHGRDFSGGSHIRMTGTLTASSIQDNFFDDGYRTYQGQLDRTAVLKGNKVRGSFSSGYTIEVNGGAFGIVADNDLGSLGVSGGIQATGCQQITIRDNIMDSVRRDGISLNSTTNSWVLGNVISNVNLIPADGNIFNGISLDESSSSNGVLSNSLRQIGNKGSYGIKNNGPQNYFAGNNSAGFSDGPYYQSESVEAYGETFAFLVKARVEYGAGAPVSGRWRRGDRVWNTSSAAAQPMGWICTVAGIAGSTAVFKAMANLAA